jgi:hypothetical protein
MSNVEPLGEKATMRTVSLHFGAWRDATVLAGELSMSHTSMRPD